MMMLLLFSDLLWFFFFPCRCVCVNFLQKRVSFLICSPPFKNCAKYGKRFHLHLPPLTIYHQKLSVVVEKKKETKIKAIPPASLKHTVIYIDMGNIMSVSFAPECTPAKNAYDDCFNKWYTEKFLKGKSMENECTEFWDTYITCINANLAKQGIKPMLDKAREDQPFDHQEIEESLNNEKK
ncbi:mitochondrial distribution and morphology protein 35 [Candida albicans WO-1]|nr:mitochondrial distribution and morphology protein 35 [Candida albicans WO-1]